MHPLYNIVARLEVRKLMLRNGLSEAEASARARMCTAAIVQQATLDASRNSPLVADAVNELRFGSGGWLARIEAFFASPAGQFVLKAVEALLMLLPLFMGQAAYHRFGDRPFRDAARALRAVRVAVEAFANGEVFVALDVVQEFLEYYAEPEAVSSTQESDMFDTLITQVEALYADVSSGDDIQAVADFGALLQMLASALKPQGVGAATPVHCDRMRVAIDNLRSACTAAKTRVEGVGSIFPGDGTFLKNFASFIIEVLPVIWNLFKPAPAPAAT